MEFLTLSDLDLIIVGGFGLDGEEMAVGVVRRVCATNLGTENDFIGLWYQDFVGQSMTYVFRNSNHVTE